MVVEHIKLKPCSRGRCGGPDRSGCVGLLHLCLVLKHFRDYGGGVEVYFVEQAPMAWSLIDKGTKIEREQRKSNN